MALAIRRAFALVLSASLVLVSFPAPALAGAPPAKSVAAPAPRSVVREIEAKRSKTARHYLMSDGTYRAVVAADAPGRQSPKLTAGAGGAVEGSTAAMEVTFSDGASGAPVEVSVGAGQFDMDLIDAVEGTPKASGGTAVYSGVARDTSLEYELLADGIKETVVLSSSHAPSSFAFRLRLRQLELRQSGGTWMLVRPGSGTPELVLGELTVVDAAGAACVSASMSVKPTADGGVIGYEIPRAWLADPARSYPVRVDPTFTARFLPDTYVSQAAPSTDYSGSATLTVGFDGTGYNRSLLRFDCSNLEGATINSSTLSVYMLTNGSTATTSTYTQRVTSAWQDGVTWTSAPAMGSMVATSVTSGASKWVRWDAKSHVASWAADPDTNYGIALTQKEDGTQRTTASLKRFASAQYSNSTYRPVLTIDYSGAAPASSAAATATATGYDWWRMSSPTTYDDQPRAGRGKVDLSWNRVAGAAGYKVYAFDGNAYQQVGRVLGSKTTTWTSAGANVFPTDSRVASLTVGLRRQRFCGGLDSLRGYRRGYCNRRRSDEQRSRPHRWPVSLRAGLGGPTPVRRRG